MATVRLTEDSRFSRLNITPKKEITREDGETVPVKWAVLRLSDPNLMFEFSEEDREELLALDDRLLGMISGELNKDSLTITDLVGELLPKKEVIPKKATPKSKPKTTKKTPSKLKKE